MGMLSVGEKLWFINHSVYIGQQNRHPPVSIMVQKNSIRMIQIQPQINEIKYKHAGDKDRIADEQMELFKRHIIVQCLVWCQCYYRFHWFLV